MASRPRLLLVGDDLSLLQAREMILGTLFDVLISPRLSEAFSMTLKQTFDLIVVFPKTESWQDFAEYIARKHSKKMLLAVIQSGEKPPSWAGGAISMTRSPFELLKICADRFGITIRNKSTGHLKRSLKKVVSISDRGHS